MLKRVLLAVAVGFLLAPANAPLAFADGCQFVLGFKSLHDLDAGDVGDCVDNQASVANGDAQQHTTKGLMAWRKADNWTAFTNGYMTWINGPSGLVSRLNDQRFPWEGDAGAAGTTPTSAPSPASQSDANVTFSFSPAGGGAGTPLKIDATGLLPSVPFVVTVRRNFGPERPLGKGVTDAAGSAHGNFPICWGEPMDISVLVTSGSNATGSRAVQAELPFHYTGGDAAVCDSQPLTLSLG